MNNKINIIISRAVIFACLIVSIFAISLVITSTTAEAVSKLSIDQRLQIEFPDLQQAPWAEADIRLLTIRGVLGGFPDGTFRPNAPIKKIEALVMAVRTLGLEWEAKELETKQDSQFFVLEGQALEWAKGYLSAAYRNGLISGYLQELNWYEPADRAWMATLMVRMIRMEDEAKQSTYPLYFSDRHQILPNQQGYIQVMQRQGLMSGYPDNTFRPKAAMTRAELAVMFNNYFDKYMTDYTLREYTYGTIEQFNSNTGKILIRTRDKGLEQFHVHKRAPIFYKPITGTMNQLEKRSYNQLQQGQQIDFIVNEGQLVFITIQSDGYVQQPNYQYNYDYNSDRELYYVGFLQEYNQATRTIQLENVVGVRERYQVSPQLTVTNRQGSGSTSSLLNGRLYRFTLEKNSNGENWIVSMVEQDHSRISYTGDFVMHNTYNSQITVRHSQMESETFFVPQGVSLGIEPNDYVRIYAYGDYVYDWQILRPVADEGYFKKYDNDRYEITITDRQGNTQIYRVIEDPRIQVPRVSRPNISSIYENDYVRLSFDRYDQNKNGIYDEIIEISVVDQLAGTIVSADSSTVEFVDEYGLERELKLATNAAVNISGIRQATIDDLRTNDAAYFRVERGEITQVNVTYRKVEEGTVYAVRELADGSKQLILGDNLYSQQVFELTSKTKVHWTRYSNLSINELKPGTYVKVWHDGDKAVDVELIDTGSIRGIVTDYASQSVWLEATGESRQRFILAENITNGRDYIDKLVELKFENGLVKSIAELPKNDAVYYIVHIDVDGRKLWVRNEENKHEIYMLSEDTIIYEGYRQSVGSLKGKLSAKRRVQLQIVNETVVKID